MFKGMIPTNDPADIDRQKTWLGKMPAMAAIYFNQTSLVELVNGVDYEIAQAKAMIAKGARIFFHIPFPGVGQLENIRDGVHDALYTSIVRKILLAVPGTEQIHIRIGWEFNGSWQKNRAQDKNGEWDGALYAAAFSRISLLTRFVMKGRELIWICPNVNTHDYDPLLCFPIAQHYDGIGQDFYMQVQPEWRDNAGAFNWFRDEPRGLKWAREMAISQSKLYGWPEFGFNHESFANDFTMAKSWAGNTLHHACWWDRTDGGINCLISNGSLPSIGAIFKAM